MTDEGVNKRAQHYGDDQIAAIGHPFGYRAGYQRGGCATKHQLE